MGRKKAGQARRQAAPVTEMTPRFSREALAAHTGKQCPEALGLTPMAALTLNTHFSLSVVGCVSPPQSSSTLKSRGVVPP